jgi:hypothetical protein
MIGNAFGTGGEGNASMFPPKPQGALKTKYSAVAYKAYPVPLSRDFSAYCREYIFEHNGSAA